MMHPQPNPQKPGTSGIARVVEAYFKHLPKHGIELVDLSSNNFDLMAVHISAHPKTLEALQVPLVLHSHGLHWTADYHCDLWQYKVNSEIVQTLRYAKEVTVPSAWVGETFQRDMRFSPHIIPHGISWHDWHHNEPQDTFILWNKNRPGDVCDATPVVELARRFSDSRFATTFLPKNVPTPNNVSVMGLIPFPEMKKIVQRCLVYLSTTKETFGIGVLEAMASGRPVLGFAHGGNADLIEHGVTGYLAQPGDYDDLAEGLAYCLAHRKTLGDNGRELARKWSWEPVCEQVAQVYRQAAEDEPATVAVVIPVYNKSEEQIRRAVESAVSSPGKTVTSIIVVDDGSRNRDEVARVVSELSKRDSRIRLIRQHNRGVAEARNRGILESDAKYITCLDSDDAIEPDFIRVCVQALEADRSLGIAYTSLRYVKEDGETGVSQWPGEFDYDRQLKKQNQVPTCCVFRREMWERLGGYNQKYAPDGAGAEDAEFWLRAGAYGYRAEKVTNEPLFIYSFGGQVSANPNYVEPDWTALHPWAGQDGDGKHPFASVATPHRLSHPIRQYDSPDVSVIIPVGPGHEGKVRNALDSLEAQTFRNWEVIIFDDTGSLENSRKLTKLLKSYPYARYLCGLSWIGSSVNGEWDKVGPGFARNRGAENARAPFLVFLDADDWLYPRAIEKSLKAWKEHESVIYTDYVGKAFVDNPADLDPVLQQNLYSYNDRTKEAIIGYAAADFDCELAQSQPQSQPYIWCNVTALIPKVWHNEIGGFDESMTSWEDVDYHWRLAKAGKCYHRIEEELMVYQFHTGHRRERGRQTHEYLLYYLKEKHERIEAVGCRGCGGSRRRPAPTASAFARGSRMQPVDDDDFVMATYMPRSTGRHQLTGGHLFPQRLASVPKMRNKGRGWSIDYGQHQQGETFLVHRADIRAMPGLFMEVREDIKQTAPVEEKEPLAAPEPVTGQMEAPEPIAELSPAAVVDHIPGETEAITARPFDLQKLPGVGPSLAEKLLANGVTTKESLLTLGADGLGAYKGIGPTRAERIIKAIERME